MMEIDRKAILSSSKADVLHFNCKAQFCGSRFKVVSGDVQQANSQCVHVFSG